MEELKENNAPRDRAILVGLSSPRLDRKENADEESLEELGALVETAGGVSVGVVLQTLPSPNPHTFIGEGKVDEIRELVKSQEATMVIFDNDLSPSQMRVLCEEFGVQVLDRSGLILDIFAQRAKTKEGRLQVELAQYQYLLPRLIGMWTHLERQAGTSGKGPIGSKGPGETQLETDRRHIHRKIDKLKADLEEVRRVRATQRDRRSKNEIPVVAIVGQTTDFRTCRLRGRAVRAADGEQKALVDRMFELNPSMDQLYPAESRYVCEVFYIEDGSGEYFDLGQKPIVRVPFTIGRASLNAKGVFEVSEGCEGCGVCAAVCPQGCVARAEDGTFRIDQGACLRCGLCEEACPHGAIFRSAGCADGWTRENRASTWCSTSS